MLYKFRCETYVTHYACHASRTPREESGADKKTIYPGAENRLTKPSKYDPKPGDPEGKILAFDGTEPRGVTAAPSNLRLTIR